MTGLDRPKAFIGMEEDFQHWAKKTVAFFAVMLERSAGQVTEITQELIDLELLPIAAANVERGVSNLEFVQQQMHTAFMTLTSYDANDIVADSRKNPLEAWRRLQKRDGPTTGGRKRNLLRTIISLGWCSLFEFQARIERSYVSRYEKELKDTLDRDVCQGEVWFENPRFQA